MVCVSCNMTGTSNNQHSIGFQSPLGSKTLQGSVLVTRNPNFDGKLDDIKLWVDPESINIEVD